MIHSLMASRCSSARLLSSPYTRSPHDKVAGSPEQVTEERKAEVTMSFVTQPLTSRLPPGCN